MPGVGVDANIENRTGRLWLSVRHRGAREFK